VNFVTHFSQYFCFYCIFDTKTLTLMFLILPYSRKKKESSENKNGQFHAGSYNIHNSYLNQYYYPGYPSYSSTYDWNYDYNGLNPPQNILQVQ